MVLLHQPRFLVLLLSLSSMWVCAQTAEQSETPDFEKTTQGSSEDGRLASRLGMGRRLAQDSWIDPFQGQLPGRDDSSSLFRGWFKSKQQSEVELAAEEGRKRLEFVSAAMTKRAKELSKASSPPEEDEVASMAAAQTAFKLATGWEQGAVTGRQFFDRVTDEKKDEDRNWKKKGGKMSPFDLAKKKMKKEREDLYVKGMLEGADTGGESEFLIIEDPAWEEGITDEFVRQYLKELQGDYEGLDDTMHFQIDRVESQIREYARVQADAVWKAWEEVVREEKGKRAASKIGKSVGQSMSKSKQTSGTT